MKKILQRGLGVLAAFLTAVCAMLPLERADKDASRWMEDLADSRTVASLSIPGTHNSAAVHAISDVSGKCQSLSVAEQLTLGVRYLDLRLRQDGDSLHLVHSFVDQRTPLEEVLNDLTGFLAENPSEFLLVSFKEDADPVRPEGSFAECLEHYLKELPCLDGRRTLPGSVGEARGKIFVIARYENASVGLPLHGGWKDDDSFTVGNVYVQDNYRLEDSAEKIADIQKAFAVSAAEEYDLVLNFTSCYLTTEFMPTYAAAPARDVLPFVEETAKSGSGSMGVTACDFMTSGLAEQIIGRNFR